MQITWKKNYIANICQLKDNFLINLRILFKKLHGISFSALNFIFVHCEVCISLGKSESRDFVMCIILKPERFLWASSTQSKQTTVVLHDIQTYCKFIRNLSWIRCWKCSAKLVLLKVTTHLEEAKSCVTS